MKKMTYDLSQIKNISDNDPDFIKMMVDTFVKEMPVDLERLAAAVVEEDRVNVHRFAHKIKPSLELFGLKGHQQALVLEAWTKNNGPEDLNEDFMKLQQELEETLIQLKRDF
ncbi:Hpt domain-containing protein [Nonlabens sp.]|uniref:Hpt domain-containing protein n=1 Tax=Nonlabens sp. TaxID=1888209 RepID=UPI003F6A1113